MLQLYQAEWCPYSRRVRRRLTELQLDFVAGPVILQLGPPGSTNYYGPLGQNDFIDGAVGGNAACVSGTPTATPVATSTATPVAASLAHRAFSNRVRANAKNVTINSQAAK